MKHLPKHLQPRWRYLAVGIEAWPDADFDRGAFQRDLWYAAQNLYGDAGSAEADLTVLAFHYADGDGETIVRAHRGTEDRARAAVAALDRVDGKPVGLRIRGISGTVRACEERYLKR
ncbi:ribonuclease P [Halobellus limi]|uniref:Ribonuclease P protein component 2 n=1 Tax=Halobellus limi TaxID=699433 RepID=A0A1H5ZDR7_9EURY|nr:ribonuclease P [Halobellus limi]SEG34204.1 ribonuclease P/MRP protein subunit POP5 [Halobellus limi]